MSIPVSTATPMLRRSRSLTAGRGGTGIPGNATVLRESRTPLLVARQRIIDPSTATTSRRISPSSIMTEAPGFTYFSRLSTAILIRPFSESSRPEQSVSESPSFTSIGAGSAVVRISGPLVSMSIFIPGLTRRIRVTMRRKTSGETWAELILTPFIPAPFSMATKSSVHRISATVTIMEVSVFITLSGLLLQVCNCQVRIRRLLRGRRDR